ncbi:MAG: RNA-directed DNA polymerase [Chloroflexi bacterium]|nr:RNA-directed DNA polymerase [Chloroflexota bacterium]
MTSANGRLTRLLDRGFYPVELPPPFQTRQFSSVRHTLVPPQGYTGSTTFFDGATFSGTLRTFGVINPANFMLLSQFIAKNWREITNVYRLSSCSGARPKFPNVKAGGRAIKVASIAAKRTSQLHLASIFPTLVSLDINRFYGSIYTHSIPWAVLGKEEAKRRFRAGSLNSHWSDALDKLVRNCNQCQTIGIPIGPDTSRILSELVLARIDVELTALGTGLTSRQIFHNIDDYQIGASDLAAIENAQSHFVRAISRYELRLNDFKTSINQGLHFAPSSFRQEFDVLTRKRGKTFVEHFFGLLYAQAKSHPDTNVVGYVLKRFTMSLAKNPQQSLVREYLQRLIYAVPHQARWILPLLLNVYARTGINAEVRRLLSWGIETCARRNDVGSLLWFLYSAIFLRMKLSRSVCGHCIGVSNELVDLTLYHGRHLGLFVFPINELRAKYASADFQSPGWLPLYEIERRGWDHSPAFRKLGGQDDPNNIYDHLRANNVEFYVTDDKLFTSGAFEGWSLKKAYTTNTPDKKDTDLDDMTIGYI